MTVAEHIKSSLLRALIQVLTEAGERPRVTDVPLEFPGDLKNGDYASGVAFHFAKAAKMSPKQLAEKIVAAIGAIEGVAKVDVAGAGFINFHLSGNALATTMDKALNEDMWGSGVMLAGKKIMVDYTQPNPFKPFHIGHLMSNATGEALTRLFQFQGASVVRANYQGDVGLHIGKAIWGLRDLKKEPTDAHTIGVAYAHGSKAYEADENAKAAINSINKAVYDRSDESVNAMYDAGRKVSLEHFEELYAILGTKFDEYFFESVVWREGLEVVRSHIGPVFEESQGAVIFPGEKYGLNARVFITAAGLPTYEGKEMGLIDAKFKKYPLDVSVVTTAVEQENFFKVTTKAAEMVDPSKEGKILHVAHGMMRLTTGKMSSRTGDVITGESLLQDLIEEAKVRAAESRADDKEKLAENVAVAAIKYQILRQGSGKDIVFDKDRALSLEGDSGPYLQYAHARARAVVEKAAAQNVMARFDESVEISDIVRFIHRFPGIVERAAGEYEPHLVATYLIELAAMFNHWYAMEHILDGSATQAHKVAIASAVGYTLKNGLWILGIPAPEKM
jgi:arginyl-tRNA synthetase